MLIDSRELEPDSEIRTRVCVIGAGAAGITIARALTQARVPAVLLESGDFSFDGPTQALYRGETDGPDGKDYLETSRLRFFGGSTNHWTGNCRPLDPLDLEAKPWMPDSGWPFGREELDRWYPEAARLCQLGPFAAFRRGPPPPDAGLDLPGLQQLETALFQTGPPTRFGIAYREELLAAPSLCIHTHANVLRLETDPDGGRVAHVLCSTLDGRRSRVVAERFVLACGGIENARVLLLSDRVPKQGLGNGEDQVGRWFGAHPTVLGAALGCFWRPAVAMAWLNQRPATEPKGHTQWAAMTLTEQTRRALALRNAGIVLKPLLRKRRLLGLLSVDPARLDPICATAAALDGLRGGRPIAATSAYELRLMLEMAPHPDNRVTLDRDSRDALGQPRAHLRWAPSADDLDSMWRTLEVVGRDLGAAGLGRVRLNREPGAWSVHPNKHHMGTTRMHASPKRGVTDADCRVHGVANLYVAGSSVFPSYGYANPTLTLVALARRLADHLIKT